MSTRYLSCVIALALLTAACDGSGSDIQVFGGNTDVVNRQITLHDGTVVIKAAPAPDARVDANGTLTIDGHEVTLTDAQRALLQRYNGAARQMREDAIATGKAGIATATKALGAAAGKITGADSADETSKKADEAAANVELAAAKICDDIADMKTAQDAVATQLDAFKPYASALTDENIAHCRKGTKH